jgi:hypothetical protein
MKYMMHSITKTILLALVTRNRFIIRLRCWYRPHAWTGALRR